jgi:hypothetical protein
MVTITEFHRDDYDAVRGLWALSYLKDQAT